MLIVNYRTYSDLARCLASLVPHLGPADEVVVVDYESDLAALNEAVKQTARSVPLVTVPRADNRGFAAGVTLAAARTRAPYLLLLNPDAVFEGPVIEVLESWFADHPDAGVAGARVLNADGTVQPTARRFPDLTTWFGGRSTWLTSHFPKNWFSQRNLVGLDARSPIDVDWLSGACLMTRRDVFERLGGLDESFFLYWEDADYSLPGCGGGLQTHVRAIGVGAAHRGAGGGARSRTGHSSVSPQCLSHVLEARLSGRTTCGTTCSRRSVAAW